MRYFLVILLIIISVALIPQWRDDLFESVFLKQSGRQVENKIKAETVQTSVSESPKSLISESARTPFSVAVTISDEQSATNSFRCPVNVDYFLLDNHEGKYIEVCQVEDAEFDFQANFSDYGDGPACRLKGTARANGSEFVYSNDGCAITFSPFASGMNVVFNLACSNRNCDAGINWRSGEYAGKRSYVAESGKDAVSSNMTWNFLGPGATHSGESPLQPGTGWLALRKGQQGWVLVETEVHAKKVLSDITDYDIQIRSNFDDAIAMFRLPELVPGPVTTAALPDGLLDEVFSIDQVGKLIFNHDFIGTKYQFRAETEKVLPGDTAATSGVLLVASEGKISFIGYFGQGIDNSEDTAKVIWAGDLDRDNKLDVITSVSGRNSSGICLHLSGGATGNQLFAKSICHDGSGC